MSRYIKNLDGRSRKRCRRCKVVVPLEDCYTANNRYHCISCYTFIMAGKDIVSETTKLTKILETVAKSQKDKICSRCSLSLEGYGSGTCECFGND